jgi:O-methyltransferase involved in polyketide biosynthesis
MDTGWMEDIKGVKDGILFFSGGVLEYFEETEIKKLLSKLADRLARALFCLMSFFPSSVIRQIKGFDFSACFCDNDRSRTPQKNPMMTIRNKPSLLN